MPERGTVLGFDFGLQRIGIAIGELELGIAHPLETIDDPRNAIRFARIEALLKQWQPVLLVVGLPVHMDGTEHAMTATARRFAHRLEGRFRLPVTLADERLTSAAAAEHLHAAGIFGGKHQSLLDQTAAHLILQSFFDARPGQKVR